MNNINTGPKLSPKDCLDIALSDNSTRDLAEKYRVSASCISAVRAGSNFKAAKNNKNAAFYRRQMQRALAEL